jgi:hypothetical protein
VNQDFEIVVSALPDRGRLAEIWVDEDLFGELGIDKSG